MMASTSKLTRVPAANLLGISATRLDQLVNEQKIRRNPDGSFDRRHLLADRKAQLAAGATKGRGNGIATGTLREHQIRIAAAKADLAEMMAGKRRGDLVEASEVEKIGRAAGQACKEALVAIPARLAPIVAGSQDADECERLIAEEVRRALEQLARDLEG